MRHREGLREMRHTIRRAIADGRLAELLGGYEADDPQLKVSLEPATLAAARAQQEHLHVAAGLLREAGHVELAEWLAEDADLMLPGLLLRAGLDAIRGEFDNLRPDGWTQRQHYEWDSTACLLHNTGASLTGNTQESDQRWLARLLYDWSTLGAGDVSTISWALSTEEWVAVGLSPKNVWSDGPRWDALEPELQQAWMKLARLVMYCLPRFADRVGSRFMEQAEVLRAIYQNGPGKTLAGTP